MSFTDAPHDLTEENLSNISMLGHHRSNPQDILHEGVTLPMPQPQPHSPAASHHSQSTAHSMGSHMSSQTITAELPPEAITHPSGMPVLGSYRDGNMVRPQMRFNVPTAAKTFIVKQDPTAWARRNTLLEIYAENFSGDSARFGPSNTIASGVYDAFPGIEQLVDKTLRGCQVEYDLGHLGNGRGVGYFLDPSMYLTLHKELRKLNDRWAPILLRVTGQSVPVPRWFRFGMAGQVWPSIEFEMYAVKFREEVETFLSLIYRNRHAMPGGQNIEDPSRRQRRRQLEDIRDVLETEQENQQLSPPAVLSSQPLQMQSEPKHFPLGSTSGLTRPRSRPLPSISVHSQTRQPLVQRGYVNNPAALSHSRRLSEVAGVLPPEVVAWSSTPNPQVRGPGPNIASSVPLHFQYQPRTPNIHIRSCWN